MIRNLKALGLALVAVFAMSAMVASAASAQNGIITSDGPFTLKGVNRAGSEVNANSLSAFGATVTCPNVVYTGHKVAETPHVKIPNNSSTATITPHYGVCQVLPTIKATVDMNGCDYELHLTETSTPPADRYKVTTTVICPAGKHIVITLFTTAAFHASNEAFCHITITEAKSYDGLFLTDNTTTPNSFTLNGEIKNVIEAHKETLPLTGPVDKGILCPQSPKTETTTTATLKADVTITENTGTGIKLSHL